MFLMKNYGSLRAKIRNDFLKSKGEQMKYNEFLNNKVIASSPMGFEAKKLNPMLYDFQHDITHWALKIGRAAIFAGCGLGKTPMQLEWANKIYQHTNKDILILAPLAVNAQTKREGSKFGIEINICRSQSDVKPGINIANYEMVDKFDHGHFIGVVLDESSILKSFMGNIKRKIINYFKNTKYKLACTATPSPNDHMELLNHSDFLNVMPSNEALSRWFINDTMHFGTYRLKGHAVNDFWEWVSTWAACLNKPSDLGYDDNGFILPELKTIKHIIDYEDPRDYENGKLFRETRVINATNLYKELTETLKERVTAAAELINPSNESWVVWCHKNDEANELNKKINGSINVHGSLSIEKKEKAIEDFTNGKIKVMVTKPSMCGFGLNWQHCHNMAFVGLSYSFEQRYQASRRLWRFGQKKPVYEHLILSPAENQQVLTIVKRKEQRHMEMENKMAKSLKNYTQITGRRNLKLDYKSEVYEGSFYKLILGDAVNEIKNLENNSVHFQIFSPPFSNLYIYSDMVQDMGNSKNDKEFFKHFEFLIPQLYRILVPGRLCAVHCKDLVDYKGRDGEAGLRDVPGEIIRLFESNKFKYHSRVTIWKDPVIEMQRTKAQGLLHKQIKKDSSMCRQGLPDYLLLFRKWPDNSETSGPDPIKHPQGFKNYIGENIPQGEYITESGKFDNITNLKTIAKNDDIFSIHVWQRYASPVWFDIKQTNVLNCRIARDDQDEKHICPLQLDVIERAIHLWSNPADTVFTPFAGIGSEVYSAVKLGRYGIGIELKKTYIQQAVDFLEKLENKPKQLGLFD